jgi:UDP-N-acetylmuramoyl-tripeptide--D-alanyl-D-alanine ligase
MHRERLNVPVLAVTGTNGKTTTKELLALTLSKKYKVHYTKGNLNNHIGVPLTILSAPAGTELMIIEMGANHPGEIRTLCSIARPDYGIITNVGNAHLEGFGSFEGVVRTKSELYEFLGASGGTAIYNDENNILSEKIRQYLKNAIPYSRPGNEKITIDAIHPPVPLTLKAIFSGKSYTVKTNLFGAHNLENVRAAFAAGLFLGIDINAIIDAVTGYKPGNNRSEIKLTGSNTLICDSYNANPTSMKMAIGSFNEITGVKKAVILGDMFELGEQGKEEHERIAELVSRSEDTEVFLVGPQFQLAASGKEFKTFFGTHDLIEYLKKNPLEGRTILIKGSRGMALERVYDLL